MLEHQTGPSVHPPVTSVHPPVTPASYHGRTEHGVIQRPLGMTYGY